MASTDSLTRRLISANERLKQARRDGCCADIVTWRNICDHLLDEWNEESKQQSSAKPS